LTRRLGELAIFPVALGAMNLSIEGRPPRDVARATIRAALDEGVTLIDTADVYGLDGADANHGLRLLAEARGAALVSSKVGVRREGTAWVHDGRPAYLRAAAEASLHALRAEAFDVLHLHAVDARVPIEDSVGELARLREEGKARRLGVSNVTADELRRARASAPIACVQNEASPFVAPDPAVLALCEAHGLAFLAYAPVGGWRAGRVAHDPTLRALAEAAGVSPYQVALAALLGRSPAIVPVAGASRPENARASARAASLRLAPEAQARFERTFWGDGG
jgi:aryl-alcohol dehydrogenase-like predicted oxidoreductase